MSTQAVLRFTVDGQKLSIPIADRADLGLTPRESGRVRRITGLAGVAIGRALLEDDQEVLAALLLVAATRVGAELDETRVLDGVIRFDYEVEVVGDDPPVEAAAGDAAAAPSSRSPKTRAAGGAPS